MTKTKKQSPLKRPSRAILFHLPFKIIWSKAPILDNDGKEANGLCEANEQRLSISAKLEPGMQAEILLHEMMHGWHSSNGISDTTLRAMSEEDLVCLESRALAAVLRDNPELFGWVIDQLTIR